MVRMRPEGATRNPAPKVAGLEVQTGISNFILRNDPAKLRVDGEGNLVLAVAGGEIVQKAPRVPMGRKDPWRGAMSRSPMATPAGRRGVAVGMAGVGGGRAVGFVPVAYDPALALVVDPEVVYSLYLGGSVHEVGFGIAVDGAGNAYVTGETDSTDFPTKKNTPYPYSRGIEDAFVFKLKPQC